MNLSKKYKVLVMAIFMIALAVYTGFIFLTSPGSDTASMDIKPGEGVCGVRVDNTGIIEGRETAKSKLSFADTCVGGVYYLREGENVSGGSCNILSLKHLYVTSGNFSSAYMALKGNSVYEYAVTGWLKAGGAEWISPGNYFFEYSNSKNSGGWSRIRAVSGPNGDNNKYHSYKIKLDTGNVNGYIDEMSWSSKPDNWSRISSIQFIGERTVNNGNNDTIFPGTKSYSKEKFAKIQYTTTSGLSYIPNLTFYSLSKYASLDYSEFNMRGQCSFEIWDARF